MTQYILKQAKTACENLLVCLGLRGWENDYAAHAGRAAVATLATVISQSRDIPVEDLTRVHVSLELMLNCMTLSNWENDDSAIAGRTAHWQVGELLEERTTGVTANQIQDLGFAMLPSVPCGEFTAFARAVLALRPALASNTASL
jgi:hypothetical protein